MFSNFECVVQFLENGRRLHCHTELRVFLLDERRQILFVDVNDCHGFRESELV